MNRIIKNILMMLIIIAICSSIVLTINYAKNHLASSNEAIQNMNTTTPPDSENNNMEAPPEKPTEDSTSDTANPSEKPDSTDNNTKNESPKEENNPNKNDNNQIPLNTNINLSYPYYIAFTIESFVLAFLVIYLIMSKFNKKNYKETFSSSDKVVIDILALIILTSTLTFFEGFITNKYILNNNDNKLEKIASSNNSVTYQSTKEITEETTIDSGDFSSEKTDENAILVSGNISATLSNINVIKTGDSAGGDTNSFYGNNSAIIAKDKANLTLKKITITTDAKGANGVFSYGGSATTTNSSNDGTTITISDSQITTKKDNSGGIMTTGGGIMKATNLTVTTAGISSAAIRTDRGGGTVEVDGGTYTTTNQGSPAIYSTANITVNNAKLISKVSEGIVIEGKNSVTINNCNLTDSNTKLNGQSTTYKNIFLYQSMSGDADTGISKFTAANSNITTNNGDTFYITNTTATINLENNQIINNDSSGNFLRAQSDSWGETNSNGGKVNLIMTNQKAQGNIVIDSISTLNMTLKSNSYYEGIINSKNEAKEINLTLSKNSQLKLTGNSYITSLDNADTSNSNINFNGYKLYINGTAVN